MRRERSLKLKITSRKRPIFSLCGAPKIKKKVRKERKNLHSRKNFDRLELGKRENSPVSMIFYSTQRKFRKRKIFDKGAIAQIKNHIQEKTDFFRFFSLCGAPKKR